MLTREHSIIDYDFATARVFPDRLTRKTHQQYVDYAERMLTLYRHGVGQTHQCVRTHRRESVRCPAVDDVCPVPVLPDPRRLRRPGARLHGTRHRAVLHHGTHLPAPTRAEHPEEDAGGDDGGERHHEQAVDLHLDDIGDVQRAHHPRRQFDADLARRYMKSDLANREIVAKVRASGLADKDHIAALLERGGARAGI